MPRLRPKKISTLNIPVFGMGLLSFLITVLVLNFFLYRGVPGFPLSKIIYIAIALISLFLSVQGIFTLFWMLYAWEDPESADRHKSPKVYQNPKHTFTALLPARHEEKVIRETIRAISQIDYPEKLKELLVLCRADDKETISQAKKEIRALENNNIRLIVFNDYPINKPHSLNIGLWEAKNQVVTIFDAEDQPHKDIYNIVNTVMFNRDVDVVQSGVQLMNYSAHWFSALNVMEYFLWFKSGLQFFLRMGNVTSLGGNTVFIKKRWLKQLHGWDENCLTEDADIGIRLIAAGAKTQIIYDEKHVTQEETPTSVSSFIKQRTRWNQGFLQIFLGKGDWRNLPQMRQKLVILYILLSPLIQAFMFLYMPFSLWIALTQKMPVAVTLLSFVPFYLFVLQILVYIIGLYEFTKEYKLKFYFWLPLKVLLTFYPYQLLLMFSSFRAFYRIALSKNGWEKTLHINGHRTMFKLPLVTRTPKPAYA